MGFRFADLFAGIGGIRLAFERAGGHCVFSCENDPDARRTYEANFGEVPSGDITAITAADVPDFDVLLAGFPCQAFSRIGLQEGFANETSGTMFFEVERFLREKRPAAFLLENVRGLVSHDHGRTLQVILAHLGALGYTIYWKVLNALDFGVPQKRERIIFCGFLDADVPFSFPTPVPEQERLSLADILEPEQDIAPRYFVSAAIRASRLARTATPSLWHPYISHENLSRTVTPHPYASALRASASANYQLVNDERRLTEREMLRLQGFPDSFRIVCRYTSVRRQCGNSVAVPMIQAVARAMASAVGWL